MRLLDVTFASAEGRMDGGVDLDDVAMGPRLLVNFVVVVPEPPVTVRRFVTLWRLRPRIRDIFDERPGVFYPAVPANPYPVAVCHLGAHRPAPYQAGLPISPRSRYASRRRRVPTRSSITQTAAGLPKFR